MIKLADHRGNIRLKKARADDGKGDAEEEELMRVGGQNTAAGNHQQAAPEQRFAEAENLISKQAADERERINKGLRSAVLQVGYVFLHQQLRHHKEGEHAAHTVEAKALPHFREEQVPKLLGVLAGKVLNGCQAPDRLVAGCVGGNGCGLAFLRCHGAFRRYMVGS